MKEIIISNHNGEPVASSLEVAKNFDKEHKDVLKAIRTLKKDISENLRQSQELFFETIYLDKYNRKQKCYEMTRDGFTLLAMGFSGQKALAWKLKYIQAFNQMEQQIKLLTYQKEYGRIKSEQMFSENQQKEIAGSLATVADNTSCLIAINDSIAQMNEVVKRFSEKISKNSRNEESTMQKAEFYDKEEVKSRFSEYVANHLQKDKNGFSICPSCGSGTHQNGTPALKIYPDHGYCHSCGKVYDTIELHMQLNHIPFSQAMQELGEEFHLIPRKQSSKQKWQVLREHVYTDADRKILAKKTMYRKPDGTKTGVWYLFDSQADEFRKKSGLDGLKMPLYHADKLQSSAETTVYFTEGEKDAERLEKWGYTATCTPNGASQTTWHKEYNKYLNQRDIVILCDNDEAGAKYGNTVARNVHSLAKSVKIIPATAIWSECPKKWDISDIADKFGDKQARKFLSEAVQKAELYTPPADITQTPEFKAAAERLVRRITASSPYDVDGTGILTIENLEAYMKAKNYRIYYDDISRRFIYEGFKGESILHIEENAPTIIYDELQLELKKCSVNKIDMLLRTIATRNRVNPILDMIQNAVWDGTDRLEQIYQMFGIDETDTMSRTLFKKWCMQAIAALYNKDKNPFSLDIVLVFQGAQGIAKTRFFEHLAMNPMYFGEGYTIDTRNKDSIIEATCNWIVELGEIGSTMRKDMDSLKAFLTKSMDEYRQPFGKKSLKYPRRTVFVGTVNDEKYLIDETGNRRFATIQIKEGISLDYETQIATFDSLQFWAQIYEIVQAEVECGATIGGCFRLTALEREQLEQRNIAFTKPLKGETEVIDILAMFDSPRTNMKVEYRLVTVTEFCDYHPRLNKYSSVQVGKVLTKLGIKPIIKKINGIPTHLRTLPFWKQF